MIQDRYFDGECILLKDAIEDSEQQTKLVQQMHFLYQTKAPGNNYTDQMGADPRHQTLIRTWIRHSIWFLLSAMLLCQASGYSQLGPQPPCGKEPVPPYPGLDDSAIAKSWSKSEFGRDWQPPACTGWAAVGFTTLVTTVARFRHTSEAEGLLRHIGAISQLSGMRYWSTTHKQWQTLIVDAYALTGLQPSQRREDFTPEEMKEGKVLYYVQVDNLSRKATYRMHIVEASADRIVFDVENVSTMHYLFITLFHPGENAVDLLSGSRIGKRLAILSCAQERTQTG